MRDQNKTKTIKEMLTEEGVTYKCDENEIFLIKDDVKVEWVRLGEGYRGDYDPNDPDDEELLRYDVSVLEDGQWEKVEGASYCTLVPVTATEEEKLALLKIILDHYYEVLHNNHDASVGELTFLSWISLDYLYYLKRVG